MATIQTAKIGTVTGVAPGETSLFTWNNPPWETVLGYFAYPVPPNPSGPHGAANGTVAVVRVDCTFIIDHYNGDKKRVVVHVQNTGTEVTGYELFESWIA